MTFSNRYGLGRTALQINSMDYDLRVGLWNAIYSSYRADIYSPPPMLVSWEYGHDRRLRVFSRKLLTDLMKQPLGSFKFSKNGLLNLMGEWISKREWNRVYDLIEFLPSNYPGRGRINPVFRAEVNRVLKNESAGYRFIGDKLVRITAEGDVQAIEKTLKLGGPFTPASEYLRKALQLLSNRESPDYPNSIKESITAVEAAAEVVSGKSKATLGDALKAIGDESAHPALRDAFSKLYGWTSDAAGIRHANLDGTSVGLAEAQFMVVTCSAFINYLAAKFKPDGNS